MRLKIWNSLLTFIILLVINVNSTNANESIRITKLYGKAKFTVIKSSEITKRTELFLYDDTTLMAKAKVLKCKKKYCLARLTKKYEAFDKVEKSFQVYLHEISHKEISKTKKDQQSYAAQFGMGGIFSNGFLVGISKGLSKKYIVYGNIGYLSSTGSEVQISGLLAGLGIKRFLTNKGSFNFYAGYEFEMAKLEIEVTETTTAGFIISEIVIANILYGEIDYLLTDNFSVAIRLGYAHNTLQSSYDNSNGDSFEIPFAGGYPHFAIFGSYKF